MPDPLNYRDPATTPAPAPAPAPRPSRARGALLVGVIVFVIGVLVMLLPLAIPLGGVAKYVAAPAFVAACIGLSITANALIDWWRGK